MNDRFRPFHWPSTQDPQFIVEPGDENCPQAWDVYELEPYSALRVGQVVQEGQRFQAWGRVWDTSLGTLVPLWFRGPEDVTDSPDTDTLESAVARIVQAWQQYAD